MYPRGKVEVGEREPWKRLGVMVPDDEGAIEARSEADTLRYVEAGQKIVKAKAMRRRLVIEWACPDFKLPSGATVVNEIGNESF